MHKRIRHLAKTRQPLVFRPRAVRAFGPPIQHGDFPNGVRQGTTAHFKVYYDPPLGATIANGVLAACERDYNTIAGCFGGITPPVLPCSVVIADLAHTTVGACGGTEPAGGGACHCGCGDVDSYCDVKVTPSVDPKFTEFLSVDEIVELFEAAQGRGWDCDASNGEGPSTRVVATALYPGELGDFHTADAWLDGGRPDFVNQTDPRDQNGISNGCAVLFLNYGQEQSFFFASDRPTQEQVLVTESRIERKRRSDASFFTKPCIKE